MFLRLIAILLSFLSVLGAAAPAASQSAGNRAVTVEVAAENSAPAPGSTVTLALKMTPAKGWHGYWKNPGDAGVEGTIDWKMPAGITAGPIQYPVPETLIIAGLMNYVYERPYVQLVDLKIPPGFAPGTKLPIRGKYDFLACTSEVCVPQSADLALNLVVGAPGAAPVRQAKFDEYRRALPKPLGLTGRFETKGDRFRLAVPLPADLNVEKPYFFPATDGVLEYAAPQAVSRNGDMLIVETAAGVRPTDAIEGVLRTGPEQGLMISAEPGTVPAAGKSIASEGSTQAGMLAILAAFAGAVLGGLLLNVMPCVFPILSLKALSLARAGETERAARHEALAYTAGVVLVCAALGATLLGLRAGGASVGWAFQLQDPRVVFILLLLVTAVALNLAGLFEVPSISAGSRLAAQGGTTGAFWTGALAAFVATPCTGPFMGAALGAALVLPTAAAMAIFVGLGVGLALPFLLLGFVPALRRRLPKPGAWMARFRRILSLPMFATALGLAWVLGRQSGVDGMTLGVACAVILGLSLWWVSRRQERRAWIALLPAAAAAAVAVAFIPLGAPAGNSATQVLEAEPFSEARLATLRSQNKPVFVYFTADWCLTCKVNEKTVLDRAEVAKAFAARNVQVLVGDWTNGDPAIGRFLEQHGRSGVPLYLFYPAGGPATVLPQVLTTGMLTTLPN